jgi:hypothetical protein
MVFLNKPRDSIEEEAVIFILMLISAAEPKRLIYEHNLRYGVWVRLGSPPFAREAWRLFVCTVTFPA